MPRQGQDELVGPGVILPRGPADVLQILAPVRIDLANDLQPIHVLRVHHLLQRSELGLVHARCRANLLEELLHGRDALAAAILRLLTHPDEAKALGDQARAALRSRGMTLSQSLATLSDLYASLATSRAETPGPLLRVRMRRAMTVYRMLRLVDQRRRSLVSQRP